MQVYADINYIISNNNNNSNIKTPMIFLLVYFSGARSLMVCSL